MTRFIYIVLDTAHSRSDGPKCDEFVLPHECDMSWCIIVQYMQPVLVEFMQGKLLGRDGNFRVEPPPR